MGNEPVNKTGTYVAFYVDESTATGGNVQTAKDLCYYHTIEMWKATTDDFHFINSHDKTYNVKDESEYSTLLARLRKRLNLSRNMLLLLSSNTKQSRALNDEIEYAIKIGLPIIVAYVDCGNNDEVRLNGALTNNAKDYLKKLPVLQKAVLNKDVTTLHIPFTKEYIKLALDDSELTYNGKDKNKNYTYFYTK